MKTCLLTLVVALLGLGTVAKADTQYTLNLTVSLADVSNGYGQTAYYIKGTDSSGNTITLYQQLATTSNQGIGGACVAMAATSQVTSKPISIFFNGTASGNNYTVDMFDECHF